MKRYEWLVTRMTTLAALSVLAGTLVAQQQAKLVASDAAADRQRRWDKRRVWGERGDLRRYDDRWRLPRRPCCWH